MGGTSRPYNFMTEEKFNEALRAVPGLTGNDLREAFDVLQLHDTDLFLEWLAETGHITEEQSDFLKDGINGLTDMEDYPLCHDRYLRVLDTVGLTEDACDAFAAALQKELDELQG